VPGASSHQKYGLEAALVMGPFSLQGEYIRVDVDTSTGTDPAFSGYYAYASWFLTGESRPYAEGKFNRVKADGAWELAVRFSSLLGAIPTARRLSKRCVKSARPRCRRCSARGQQRRVTSTESPPRAWQLAAPPKQALRCRRVDRGGL